MEFSFTVHDVVHKRLRLRACKIEMIQGLKTSDQVTRTIFAVDMLEKIDASPDFLYQVCFSDEPTFHVKGFVNRYNCRIWGCENPHVTCELERGSPEVNKLIRPFFLFGKDCAGRSYVGMLELNAVTQFPPQTIFQQDGDRHISATMLRITWTEKWLGDGSGEVDQLLGLLVRQI
jgi:hypothetical protein